MRILKKKRTETSAESKGTKQNTKKAFENVKKGLEKATNRKQKNAQKTNKKNYLPIEIFSIVNIQIKIKKFKSLKYY